MPDFLKFCWLFGTCFLMSFILGTVVLFVGTMSFSALCIYQSPVSQRSIFPVVLFLLMPCLFSFFLVFCVFQLPFFWILFPALCVSACVVLCEALSFLLPFVPITGSNILQSLVSRSRLFSFLPLFFPIAGIDILQSLVLQSRLFSFLPLFIPIAGIDILQSLVSQSHLFSFLLLFIPIAGINILRGLVSQSLTSALFLLPFIL